jgi:hypothetical protein
VHGTDPTLITGMSSAVPYFGDPLVVCFDYHEMKPKPKTIHQEKLAILLQGQIGQHVV